jgi:hypothetical protein
MAPTIVARPESFQALRVADVNQLDYKDMLVLHVQLRLCRIMQVWGQWVVQPCMSVAVLPIDLTSLAQSHVQTCS